MLQAFQASVQSRVKQIMAPLRESLAQESVFDSGKLVDGKALLKAVISAANEYAKRLLKSSKDREELQAKCRAERDAVWDSRYGKRIVLENLEWAIDKVEKAVGAVGDLETRNAELEEAEGLLQTPSNFSASLRSLAHLYLALIWRLRENDTKVTLHLLEMFIASPGFARNEIGFILWEQVFQPRFTAIEAWYHKEVSSFVKHQVTSAGKNQETLLRPPYSFEALYSDVKGFWHQLQPSSARSGPLGQLFLEREERLEVLNKLFGESLDENTVEFAEFYKQALVTKGKGKHLRLPAVKLPQLQIQIVQRELVPRNVLAAASSTNSQLSSPSSMKENIRPEDKNCQSSDPSRKPLKKLPPERSRPLDGTELDETKLLYNWNNFEIHKLSRDRSTKRRSYEKENVHVHWEDKLPAHVEQSPEQPTVEDRTEMLTAMRGEDFTKQRASTPKIRDFSRNCYFQKLPVVSASSQLKTPIPGTLRYKYGQQVTEHLAELKQAIATLCIAEDFGECEQAVPVIASKWMASKKNPRMEAFLTKPAVIEILLEVLAVSTSEEAKRATVCLLTDLVQNHEEVKQALRSYDSELHWVANVVHIPQAVVLIYLLKLGPEQLAGLNLIPALVYTLQGAANSGAVETTLRAPKAAATFLLEELVTSFDVSTNLDHAELVLSLGGAPCLVKSRGCETQEEKMSALVILSECKKCVWHRLKGSPKF